MVTFELSELLFMVNITDKPNSLRGAIATAVVTVSMQETIAALQSGDVPAGNVFDMAKAAGLLAVKKTSDAIPHCHPIPIEYTAISYAVEALRIIITVEVLAICRTGIEAEAMHGAAITALTMFDMLKTIDNNIEISSIKVAKKKGGKMDYTDYPVADLRCAVVVCSDSIAAGTKQDFAGKAIIQKLQQNGLHTAVYNIIPDELELIQTKAKQLSEDGVNLLIFTGGTGLYRRDVTPQAIEPLLEINIPGIMEAARSYGQERTPYAMLSRGVAGFIKNTLVLTLPGSTRGAQETMDALFPYIIHIFRVAEGLRHSKD